MRIKIEHDHRRSITPPGRKWSGLAKTVDDRNLIARNSQNCSVLAIELYW
jgi:hypothetical protein